MKFVLAPDSFKESMTAKEVANSMKGGLKKIFPNADYVKVPMADGGEGTLQALIDATNGEIFKVEVLGPLGKPITAEFGILGNKTTAVIEMASASGLCHVEQKDRNPLITTTFGTGQLIKHALDKNVQQIFIGIGGSATNDGGAAMIHAGSTVLDHLPHGSFFHATGGSVFLSMKERLKLIPYESLVGLTLTIVSTIIYGVIL